MDLEDALSITESYPLILVNGLARRDYGSGLAGSPIGNTNALNEDVAHTTSLECADWCKHILPAGSSPMDYGGNAFNITSAEKAAGTRFIMHVNVNGWACNARGSAAKFSLAALILYSIIATSHWVYTIWIKESSSSWDTVSELVALAMRSFPSETFVNTGAGIDSGIVQEADTSHR